MMYKLNEEDKLVLKELCPRYFPQEKRGNLNDSNKDGRIGVVELFMTFFTQKGNPELYLHFDEWNSDGSVPFDVKDLEDAAIFPDFVESLCRQPREVCGCLGLALSLLAVRFVPISRGITFNKPWAMTPSFFNLGTEQASYEDINSSCVGQLLNLRGHVVRVSPPRPLVTAGAFMCAQCAQDTWQEFDDGVYVLPTTCATPCCRGKTFELRRDRVRTVECQTVRMQEVDKDSDTARMPRTQDVEIRGRETINRCVAGDMVVVVGQVKTAQNESRRGRSGKLQRVSGIHKLYILASSLTCTRSAAQVRTSGTSLEANESTQDDAVLQVSRRRDCVGLLVASMCPAIFGHDSVKLGLLICWILLVAEDRLSVVVEVVVVEQG